MSNKKQAKRKVIRGLVADVFEEYDGCVLLSVVSDFGDEHLVLASEIPGDPFDWLDCRVQIKGTTAYLGDQRVIEPRTFEQLEPPPMMLGDEVGLYGDPDWVDRYDDDEFDERY
jgi:hypothetical protein